MKILTGPQIRRADLYTIEHEPIESIGLMERASETIAQWIACNVPQEYPLLFLVGKGNNGGDGLAVARMLYHAGFDCRVTMPFEKNDLSKDCAFNLKRLPKGIPVMTGLPDAMAEKTVVVDALLGTGVDDRPLPDELAVMIGGVNASGWRVISIDMPSGMRTEYGNADKLIVHATETLSLEFPKLAQLLPQAGEWCGRVEVLPIGLSEAFIADTPTPYHYVTCEMLRGMLLPRAKFAHKSTYGHALLVCGSEGMMGAAILATGATLRSGCGLVTAHVPREERFALHASYPSALLSLDPGSCFTTLPADLDRYTAIGAGCGSGRAELTMGALATLLTRCVRPMVLDADALNLMAENIELQKHIPEGSILTPHPGELRRLVGDWQDEEHKLSLVRGLAARLGVIVVLKGAHTMTVTPSGEFYFNATGSAAMAKGGSGDVLTGLLTGLLARGYEPLQAALLGVYVHGLAGEKGADYYGAEALMSGDLVDFLAEAMQELAGKA